MTNTDDTTDTRTESTDEQTATESTDETTPSDADPSRTEARANRRARQRMADVDHTSPVEGAKRVFERGGTEEEADPTAEDPTAKPDGGAPDSERAERRRERMKDVDHTAPVAGVTRTFSRGGESDGTDE